MTKKQKEIDRTNDLIKLYIINIITINLLQDGIIFIAKHGDTE